MKEAQKNENTVEKPSVEITVRGGDEELAVIAFFESTGGVWDILVGVSTPALRDALITALRIGAQALEDAAFRPVDTASDDGSLSLPF